VAMIRSSTVVLAALSKLHRVEESRQAANKFISMSCDCQLITDRSTPL
jgi:hypothetical protein